MDYVVNAVVGINNNMMDSWDYTFKQMGVFDDDTPKVNPDDYSAENDLKAIEAAEKEMGLKPIPKDGFHKTTEDEICTANAVLRCTWGATFGQLLVIPVNRCSIGKTMGNVATIKDCLPIVNIPSFGMCFNLLNPAVAVATAAATAAAAGKFTLVPMPCGATMAPTPWVPFTKNLLGKVPIVTKNSVSCCWGIGTIDIKHCGQGLAPNTYNGFMGPDWITTLQGNAQLVANVLGALGPLAGLGSKGIAAIANLAQKAAIASRIAKIAEIGGKIAQVTSKLNQAGTIGKIGKVGNTVTGAGEAAANIVDASVSISQEKYGEGISTGADAAIGVLGTVAGTGKVKALNKSMAKGLSNIDVNQARKNMSNIPSDVDVNIAQVNKNAAQVDVDVAKGEQAIAKSNLDGAKDAQKAAKNDMKEAQSASKEAQKNLDNANKAKADADAKVDTAEKAKSKADAGDSSSKKQEADLEYSQAKVDQAEANMDVSSATADKAIADSNYTNASKAKQDADVNVSNAKVEKEKADQKLAEAQAAKAKADKAATDAQKAKANAAKTEEAADKAEKVAEEMKDRTFVDDMWYKDYIAETSENAINDYNNDKKKKEKEKKKKEEDPFSKYTNY